MSIENENTIDFGEVMHRFYAGRQYGVRGPAYDDITWMETEPKPSKEELADKWETIKDDVNLKKIQRQRSTPGEYPAKDEILVALWEMVVENRPEKAQALQARREEIKAKYPIN
jgi:hypothetical protein